MEPQHFLNYYKEASDECMTTHLSVIGLLVRAAVQLLTDKGLVKGPAYTLTVDLCSNNSFLKLLAECESGLLLAVTTATSAYL